ncbi:Cationic amino acid transporter 2, vacuolar [Thalictrum thalictroides]|uniref:Cationic amino acid transporter 2, vacuolar n=1 Tax=Thalictrum thalictroides TaxID=46969 RepID=A0A7J6VN97_THATH|nr:Cationic amino acid transporter 2, vacuolar [Thalictrum thalictroides]
MGCLFDSKIDVANESPSWGFQSLLKRKQVDSVHNVNTRTSSRLAKELTALQLIAIGVGSTVGAGVYVLVGTVAREHSGPSLTISFLIAGIAAALSAFCYAELASRCPSAGSAYHYSYICVGEGVAWLIGWALVLEYTIGGAAVARGISPNLALFFGGKDSLPFFLSRVHIPWLDVVADPCAALLVLLVMGLLCVGIKESSFAQAIVMIANVCVMAFVIVAGGYLGFKSGWDGYDLPSGSGFFPFGVNGMLAGSATVFFAYIGFDVVASTAEEVKNPHRDLPIGIGIAVFICCALYMMVSVVIVGLVPYYAMDPDTPISSAFATHGMQWAAYIITAGAVTALCSTLMGSLLPQPRILLAMARDGLLPEFFSDVNRRTQVPVKGTIVTGTCAALLTFFMDVSQLAGMVSVGTLLAFTIVAVSILILRYIPPDQVPLPPSLQESVDSMSFHDRSGSQDINGVNQKDMVGIIRDSSQHLQGDGEASLACPLIMNDIHQDKSDEQKRRRIAAWSIASACIGVLLLTSGSSASFLPSFARISVCGVGGVLLLSGLIILYRIDQDDARHSFGHSGGFLCPFVPLLPIVCILVNVYLMINLGSGTWIRVSIWMVVGVFVYLFYGRTHSSLLNAVYVSTARADEIYRSSSEHLA